MPFLAYVAAAFGAWMAIHILKLVKIYDRSIIVGYLNSSEDLKCVWIMIRDSG